MVFISHLREIYQPLKSGIKAIVKNAQGGNADRIVGKAIAGSDRSRSFAFFDEDKPLSKDILEKIACVWCLSENEKEGFFKCSLRDMDVGSRENRKKPTLIVSHPIVFEGFILRILGRIPCHKQLADTASEIKKQGKALKNSLAGLFEGKDDLEYYQEHLTKKILEEKRKEIIELDILISMLEP